MLSTTATLGEYALVTVDYLSNQQITNFTIKEVYKDSIDIKFVFYYFSEIAKQLPSIANYSGGIPIVDQSKLKKLQFPLVPIIKQKHKNPDLHTVFKILIKTGIFSAYIDDLESSIYQIRAIQQWRMAYYLIFSLLQTPCASRDLKTYY